jgi:hypothetical protein
VEKIMWVLDSMQDRYFRAPVLLDILETHVGYLKPGAPPDKVRRAANLSVFLGRRCQEGEHLWERRRDPGSKHGVKYMYHSKKSAQDPTEAGNIDAYKKVADAEEAAEAAKAAQAAQAAEAAERAISSGMLTQRLTSANTESKPMGWVMQHPTPSVAVAAPAPTPAGPPPLSAMEAVVAATATQRSTLDGNADAEGFHMIAHGADGFTKVKDEAEEEIPAEMLTDEIPILGYFLLEDEVAMGEPRQTPPPPTRQPALPNRQSSLTSSLTCLNSAPVAVKTQSTSQGPFMDLFNPPAAAVHAQQREDPNPMHYVPVRDHFGLVTACAGVAANIGNFGMGAARAVEAAGGLLGIGSSSLCPPVGAAAAAQGPVPLSPDHTEAQGPVPLRL